MVLPNSKNHAVYNNSRRHGKTFLEFFGGVERVVLRKGAWLPRSFTLNALVMEMARPLGPLVGSNIVSGEAESTFGCDLYATRMSPQL